MFGLSVCLSVWLCGTYIVHHFNNTEISCAPSTSRSRSKVKIQGQTQKIAVMTMKPHGRVNTHKRPADKKFDL